MRHFDRVRTHRPFTRNRQRLGTAALAFCLAMAGTACTNDSAPEAEPKPNQAQQQVAQHLEDLGVNVDTTECEREPSAAWTCRVVTTRNVTVDVRLTDANGTTYYETVSGLIDGAAIENRLSQDYGLRLSKTIDARCPDIIQANNGDTTKCTLTPAGETARTVTVKILDNSTGDYTVIATGAK